MNNEDPAASFSTLFLESANRTTASLDLGALFIHIFVFPIELLAKFLPGSIFLLLPLLLFFYKKPNKYFHSSQESVSPLIKLLLLLCLINFIPYWISVGARVRYVLPLLPLLGIVASYLLLRLGTSLLQKRFAQLVLGIIVLRLIVGVAVIPLVMKQKDLSNSDKAVAMDLLTTTELENKKLACDCTQRKAVCLYIDIEQHRVLKTSRLTEDWDYLISCETNPDYETLKSERFAHFEDNEADGYFEPYEILRKEKRIQDKLWQGKLRRRAEIEYIVKKK